MMSVIIPCRDDERLHDCLLSIDDPEVEVVISLNGGSLAVEQIAMDWARRHSRTTVVQTSEPNLANALELGSVAANGDILVYMDSDCRFAPGALSVLRAAAETHEVVKGHVIFESDSLISRIIALTREHHTADVLTAYKPPLAIRRHIQERIGGYFFDRRLYWREDSDLDARIRSAGIPIHGALSAVIHHPALSVREDLRSAYRYGIGLARAQWFGIELTEVPRSVLSTLRSKGAAPAVYMCLRNLVYQLGTSSEMLRLSWGLTTYD